MQTTQTTYRYRLMPTPEQKALLKQFAGSRRFIWNWALARKQQYYRATGKTLSFDRLCKELTFLKHQPETAWLRQIDSQLLQQALRDGVVYDRDLNAARNIAAEGKRLFERNVAVGSTETQNACRELVSPIETVGATR